jgi:hypothetical protein
VPPEHPARTARAAAARTASAGLLIMSPFPSSRRARRAAGSQKIGEPNCRRRLRATRLAGAPEHDAHPISTAPRKNGADAAPKRLICVRDEPRRPHRCAHVVGREAWFESFSTGLFVTVRYSQHGTGSGGALAGLMGSRGSSPVTPGQAHLVRGRVPTRWLSGPAASNTKATQARPFTKINTPVTRTRRHSTAHGGTTARGLQAK